MILKKKSTIIVGMKGSGKSTLAHFIASQPQYKTLIYDTIHEFPTNNIPYDLYRPKDRYSLDELVRLIDLKIKNKRAYDLLIIDEANRFIPGGGKTLDRRIVDLNDIQRHPPYEIGTIWLARRPTQLHPDVVGLADNIICFMLTGRNDTDYLNDIKRGLGDEVARLKPFYAIVFSKGQIDYIPPIEIDSVWKSRQ